MSWLNKLNAPFPFYLNDLPDLLFIEADDNYSTIYWKSTPLFAQQKNAPSTEFTLELSASTLDLKPGESKDVTVTINRSKSFSKADVMLGLSSGLPKGITIAYAPAEGLISSSTAKITAAENAQLAIIRSSSRVKYVIK